MKKTIKIAALMLVIVMTVCMFAACGNKPSGEYSAKTEVFGQSVETIYDFSGSKFTCTVKTTVLGTVNSEVTEGTFEVNEDEITFTVDDETTTVTYEMGEDYIKLGGLQYNKVK